MKCNQPRPGFELVSPCPFPMTITITPRPPPAYAYGLWCGFKWRPHHATSHLRSRLESQHQSVPGCAEEYGDPLVQSGGRWQTLGVSAGLGNCADHTNKWYMHSPTSVLENEAHKLLCDFEVKTDHLISARRLDLKITKRKRKKNLQNCGLCCLSGPQSKIERMRKEG